MMTNPKNPRSPWIAALRMRLHLPRSNLIEHSILMKLNWDQHQQRGKHDRSKRQKHIRDRCQLR